MVTLSLDITSAIEIKCSIQGDRGKAPRDKASVSSWFGYLKKLKLLKQKERGTAIL